MQPSGRPPCSLNPITGGSSMRDWLAEHAGFGFNPAYAPTDHAEAVDHGGVGIGADDGVGIGGERTIGVFRAENDRRQVFQIHLMDDAGIGRDDTEVTERSLAPAEQHVAFAVALEFQLRVDAECIHGAELIDLDGVIDDQIGGHQRIGFL